ncbi:MAG: hypothetical protein KKG54_11030 [Alphaproteobacteria bacterium]|nr:hypothetical protein [Alphaproteobacteria bacterium]MBU4038328.1 hypothetical protein [Alphaproteobacteria bacterium]MBU4137146.1 hypothetical protein [Alphaproteobacteria bacterium]
MRARREAPARSITAAILDGVAGVGHVLLHAAWAAAQALLVQPCSRGRLLRLASPMRKRSQTTRALSPPK